MSESPKVSVVMPVYNTAPYLRQCLDSVVNQTLRDIEIICVDDGSTDGSLAILEEYAVVDSRLRIVQQQNQCAGVARNNGMAQARGKYLIFWDSDDYFELMALEKLYDQCESDQADICVCGASRLVEGIDKPVKESIYLRVKMIPDVVPFSIDTNRDYILNFTNAAPWNKLFRRDFIESNNILFSTAQNAEDVYFVEVALCLASSITVVDEALIVYRRDRVGSLTNTITDSYLVPLETWIETARELKKRGVYPEASFANRALGNLVYMLRNQKSFRSFDGIIEALKQGGLNELSLTVSADIRNGWHKDCLDIMRTGSSSDVLMYLMNYTYRKLTESSMRERLAKREIGRLRRRLKRQEEKCEVLESSLSDRSKTERSLLGVIRRRLF